MTSILTNNGAMVALQTLKGINNELGTVQEQISTGKKVGTAQDNAAVWAISKTMESDVTGFNKISEGLAVAKSTVAVARDASETVTDLLTQMKDKITQAQGDGVDASSKEKLQADITALKGQIGSVVSSAQFNGVNLVDGNTASPMNVLSSLDRANNGTVSASNIGVATVKLTTDEGVDVSAGYGATQTGNLTSTGAGTPVAATLTIGAATFLNADGTTGGGAALARSEMTIDPSDTTTTATAANGLMAGDVVTFTLGNTGATNAVEGVDYIEASYTVKAGDTAADFASGVAAALNERLSTANAFSDEMGTSGDVTTNADLQVRVNETTGELEITNNSGYDADDMTFAVVADRNAGALSGLNDLDVTTDPEAAMEAIEGMIQTAIDAAAAFGTAQNQIETQAEFVGKLTDNLKAGIGAMVDADMEEASARLKALQTQQQLGIQSLSIANQAPSSVMSLFR